MSLEGKKLWAIFCTVILLASTLTGLLFIYFEKETNAEEKMAVIKADSSEEITALNILECDIVERIDEHVLVRTTEAHIPLIEEVGFRPEILSQERAQQVEEATSRYEIEEIIEHVTREEFEDTMSDPEFPGYDPEIHSMMNKTQEDNFYDSIDMLQNFENEQGVRTRRDGTQGFWDAVDWTYDEFESYGLEVYQQDFTYSGGESANVIAELPGNDPDLQEEAYMIGGHLDSINNRGDDEPAPGADDNGSGVAITLEAARIMSEYEFDRTIKFAAWGAEELGLHGSSHYASNIDPEEMDFRGKFNYDMLGYAEDDELAVTFHANEHSNWMLDYKSDVDDTYDPGVNFTYVYDSDETRSDHASFWEEGYDATLAIETEFSPYYHTEDDTLDKLTIPQIEYSTQHAIGTVAHLAGLRTDSDPVPLPPEDPEPEDGASGVNTDAELSVFVEHEEVESMDVEFFDASDDSSIGIEDDVQSGERAEVSWNGLENETEYEWYAEAEDDSGTSAESESWNFTTEDEDTDLPSPPEDLEVHHYETFDEEGDYDYEIWETSMDGSDLHVYYPSEEQDDGYPALAFGHGAAQDPEDFESWGEHFASKGYVIGLPDLGTFYGDDWPELMLDTLQFFKEENDDAESPLEGMIDEEKMGLIGFSAGAEAAIHAAETDATEGDGIVQAIAPMAPSIYSDDMLSENRLSFSSSSLIDIDPGNIDVPVQLQVGTEDEVTPEEDVEEFYNDLSASDAPQQFFVIEGADHGQYGDNDPWISPGEPEISRDEQQRIARKYTVPFFNYYLSGEEIYGEYPFGGFVEYDLEKDVLDSNDDRNVNYTEAEEIVGFEDNKLFWEASADDPDEVEHYNVYRSEDEFGPWDEPISVVDADGSSVYSFVDEEKGDADDVYWWYLVRAVDEEGSEEENEDAVQEPGDDPVLEPPEDLKIEEETSVDGLTLSWGDSDAEEYEIYYSEDQYADAWELLVTIEETEYTDEESLGGENYYVVGAVYGEEVQYSDMAFSVEREFEVHGGATEHFVSIPMDFPDLAGTGGLSASDIVIDVEGSLESGEYITEVKRWDHYTRGFDAVYSYESGEWQDDFSIGSGDGIAITVEDDFSWHITGMDKEHEVTYGDERPRHYTSIPYTLEDQTGDEELRASDLVMMIEGDLESREYISDVVRWHPEKEDHDERFYYDAFEGEWINDFKIEPGDGIGFSVESEFTLEFELTEMDEGSYREEERDGIKRPRIIENLMRGFFHTNRGMDRIDTVYRRKTPISTPHI